MVDVFFLIGCFRSGTTALASILDLSLNARVYIELTPKLLLESHAVLAGEISNPAALLREIRGPRVAETHAQSLKFGDKNPAYLAFLPFLREVWDCHVVFMHRDGRDVVRSLMDWHTFKAPVIYARAVDGVPGPEKAPEDDPWDYFLLRPEAKDLLWHRWATLDRFEKCAWFWNRFNALALKCLAEWPPECWTSVDMSRLDAEGCAALYEFLGLKGFDRARVEEILSGRVNSIQDRLGLPDSFPHWRDWDAQQRAHFDALAGNMMERLGCW